MVNDLMEGKSVGGSERCMCCFRNDGIAEITHDFRYFEGARWMYLTLGRRVGKTRKAFEKQLMQQGMSKEDAKRLSVCFEDLKDNITGMLKQGIRLVRN